MLLPGVELFMMVKLNFGWPDSVEEEYTKASEDGLKSDFRVSV